MRERERAIDARKKNLQGYKKFVKVAQSVVC